MLDKKGRNDMVSAEIGKRLIDNFAKKLFEKKIVFYLVLAGVTYDK